MYGEEISRIPCRASLEGAGDAEGEFIRFLAPRTVDGLLRLLPLQGRVAIHKQQIYFQVPLRMGNEKGVAKVKEGDIAYWPMGGALVFFTGAMQPHGSVNLVGRILSDLDVFRRVRSGTPIKVERTAAPV